MALAQLAPWLNYTPQTFLGAMESGTTAGLRERAQDDSRSEAADRLRLAYDSLAANERIHNESEQAKLAQSQSAMELREQQDRSLQNYRAQQMQHQNDLMGLRSELGHSGLDLRQQSVDLGVSRLDELERHREVTERLQKQLADIRESSAENKLSPASAENVKLLGDELKYKRTLLTKETDPQERNRLSLDLANLEALIKDEFLKSKTDATTTRTAGDSLTAPTAIATLPSGGDSTTGGKATPREKAIRANALAIAHPEWTDDQIKVQVLQEMGQ